jgi:hypothetical protein
LAQLMLLTFYNGGIYTSIFHGFSTFKAEILRDIDLVYLFRGWDQIEIYLLRLHSFVLLMKILNYGSQD